MSVTIGASPAVRQQDLAINVKAWAGTLAKGDGSTDDTAAIQGAWNAAAVSGQAVYMPAGTYKISAALTITAPVQGMTIFGDGCNAIGAPLGTVISQSSSTANGITLSGGIDQLHFHDFAVVFAGSVGTSTGVGIDMEGGAGEVNQSIFEGLWVDNFNINLKLNGVSGCTFTNVSCDRFNTNFLLFPASSNDNGNVFIGCNAGPSTVANAVIILLTSARNTTFVGGQYALGATGQLTINMNGAVETTFINLYCEQDANTNTNPVQIASSSAYFIGGTYPSQGAGYYGIEIQSQNGGSATLFGLGGQTVRIDSADYNVTSDGCLADIYISGSLTYIAVPVSMATPNASKAGLYIFGNTYGGVVRGALEWSANLGGYYFSWRPGYTTNSSIDLYSSTNQNMSGAVVGISYDPSTATVTFPGTVNAVSGLLKGGVGVAGLGAQSFTGLQTFNAGIALNGSGISLPNMGGSLASGASRSLTLSDASGSNFILAGGPINGKDFTLGWFNGASVQPLFYIDAVDNRTSVGATATTTPPGTSTFNVQGSTTLGSAGTNITRIRTGQATLSAGTVAVADTNVTANTKIFVTLHTLGTVTLPSAYGVTARTPGTGFTISASLVTDTSVVDYVMIEP
jgi:hypothetical protein